MWADDVPSQDGSNTTEQGIDEWVLEQGFEYQAAVESKPFWAQVVAGGAARSWHHSISGGALPGPDGTGKPESAVPGAATSEQTGEPGDPVGIREVQSILMSATQTSLSHFHTAGMGMGGYTEVRPSAADAMDSAYTKSNAGMRFSTSHSIQDTRRCLAGASFGLFVVTLGSGFTLDSDIENVWYSVLGRPVPESFMRLYIDYRRMRDHGLTLHELAHGAFGNDCEWTVSPDFMGMIDLHITSTRMSVWLSRMDSLVCGTPNILSCNMAYDGVTVVTRGTDILAVSRAPGVDKGGITCNNVAEVGRAFGVEAAVGVLRKLVGSQIVSDFMARTGTVLPFNKGSKEVHAKGLLTSMGFERPKDDIRRAIVSGTGMYNRGVQTYEAIMTGVDAPQNFSIHLPP